MDDLCRPWIQVPDYAKYALIIGPYNPSLADPIHKAAGIIESNMQAGRIPDDGFLLFASVPFQDVDQARAKIKSSFLCEFAANEIRQSNPQRLRNCM